MHQHFFRINIQVIRRLVEEDEIHRLHHRKTHTKLRHFSAGQCPHLIKKMRLVQTAGKQRRLQLFLWYFGVVFFGKFNYSDRVLFAFFYAESFAFEFIKMRKIVFVILLLPQENGFDIFAEFHIAADCWQIVVNRLQNRSFPDSVKALEHNLFTARNNKR
ncbi:hypothetical protein SDC9_129838 [bioreactor metagenome]|uniref:Uncharacterized protein n=1 Tax=bioreactor metagenome TaxID=1076179 RepID=A0A645D036_9ZZZZ